MNIPINNDMNTTYRSHSQSLNQATDNSLANPKAPLPAPHALMSSEQQNSEKQTPRSREAVLSMVNKVQKKFDDNGVKLSFNVIEDKETVQVEILDHTGKIIRKLPSDEAIKLSESLKNLGQAFLNKVS